MEERSDGYARADAPVPGRGFVNEFVRALLVTLPA
jgi:hypothetical protein